MAEEISRERTAFRALLEAFVQAGWKLHEEVLDTRNRPIDALISHKSLPNHLMPIIVEVKILSSNSETRRAERQLLNLLESQSLSGFLGLVLTIGRTPLENIATDILKWKLYHRDFLQDGPTHFAAKVPHLTDFILHVIKGFEERAKEKGRAGEEKKSEPTIKKPFTHAEDHEAASSDQFKMEAATLNVSAGDDEPADRPPLPFKLIPGASPKGADVIFIPVSANGHMSEKAKSDLRVIGFGGPWPADADLSAGFQIVESEGSNRIIVYVVTRRPRARIAQLLYANLPQAVAQLSSQNALSGKILYVPLLRTEIGPTGLLLGLEVTLAAFSSFLADPNFRPNRIVFAPPVRTSKEILRRLRERLSSRIDVEPKSDTGAAPGLVRSPVDASGDVGMSDAAAGEPGLDFPDIAGSFRQFIDEMVAERSGKTSEGALITIGIFGRWGTGKSTMIKALWQAFEDRYTQIIVNAWKWDGKKDVHDFFHDTFIEELRQKNKKLYRRYVWEREKMRLKRTIVALAAVGLFAGATYISFWFATDREWISVTSNDPNEVMKFGVSSVAVLILGMAYYEFVFKPLRARFASFIERRLLRTEARDLGREGLARTYQRIAYLKARDENSSRPFIFYIDDLDRCAPDRVATFIQSIHSLTAAGCVTFVACDEAYVSSALQSHFKEVAEYHPEKEDFGRNFLDKIIQVPFRVPALDNERLEKLGLTRERVTGFKAHEKVAPDSDEEIKKSKSAGPPITPTDPAAAGEADVAGGMGEKPGAVEGEQEKPIPLLPDSYHKGIKARAEKICQELGVGSPEDADAVYAFCFADRYLPVWLDKFQLAEVDTIPEGAFGGLSAATREEIVAALHRNPAIFKRLVQKRLVRISEVLNEVLKPFTLPLRLAPRDVKSLTNQLHIYLRIDPFEVFKEAKLAAAYLLADRLDPLWLDHHMGISNHIPANEYGRIARAEDETKNALKKMIDVDEVKRLGLRRWRASA